MRLSEAIRLGAMLAPQSFGQLYESKTQATCALGAALTATATSDVEQPNALLVAVLEARWPWLTARGNGPIYCPHCRRKFQLPGDVIVHLNDHHRWTRGAIAGVVEAMEYNFGIRESEAVEECVSTEASLMRGTQSGRMIH